MKVHDTSEITAPRNFPTPTPPVANARRAIGESTADDDGGLLRREAEKIARIGAWKVNPETDYLYWTEGVYEILEAPLDYKPGLQEGLKFYDAESIPLLQAALEAALRDGTPFKLETGLTTMTGRHIWTEVRGLARVTDGGQAYVMGTFQDITERWNRELRDQLRLQTLQVMATNAPLHKVLASIVNLLECGREDWCGSIMLVNETGNSLYCCAAPRLPDVLTQAFGEVPIRPGVGPCGTAAATKQNMMVEDITTHPFWAEFRHLTIRTNLRACWSIPIVSAHGDILGALAVYRPVPSMPTAEEIKAMNDVMDLAAVAITKSKAELTLQENRQRLRMALDAAIMGVWEYDFTAQRLYWSPEIFANLGVPPIEPSRELMAQLLHPEDVQIPEEAMQRALSERMPYHCEYRVIIGDRTVWIEDRGQIIWDVLNSPIKVIGTAQDITGRKHVEEATQRLMVAIDQAAEGIMFTDLEGRVLYINTGYEKICGYAREEIVGQGIELLNSGKHTPEFIRNLWQTIQQGKVWRGRFINKRKDGTLFEEDATITPIRNGHGDITSYVATKHDVTRETALERQLIEAQKMEAIGQLAGGVAHDYNNILAATLLQLDLLQTTPNLPGDVAEGLAELKAGADRAASLTRQLLMFSRRQAMEKKPVELNALQSGSLKMLHRLLGEHIEFTTHSHGGQAWIEADAGMMEQVLMNLCINARDAMPKGGNLTVSISALDVDPRDHIHPDARAGRFVCLSVKDTGTGMSPEVLQRIFEPFFTTKEQDKGTGLGLATVHGIIKQHHGWVEVTSELGKGTEFKVFLPEARPKIAAAKASVPEKMLGGSECILIVEDEDMLRTPLVKILRNAGYQVHEAKSARDALQPWQNRVHELDLLLTDMVMPGGMTGLELTTEFQKKCPELPVIIMSGYSQELTTAEPKEQPNHRLVRKPCAPQTLGVIIREMLNQRKSPRT